MNVLWFSEFDNPHLNRQFAAWVSIKLFGHPRGFGPCATMVVFDDDKPIGVMVYHGWQREAGVIEISGAAIDKRWLTRHTLREMFRVPFENMGVQTVAMRVSADKRQEHLHRMLKAYGFKRHLLPRLRGRDEDEYVFLLHDDNWKASKFNGVRPRKRQVDHHAAEERNDDHEQVHEEGRAA